MQTGSPAKTACTTMQDIQRLAEQAGSNPLVKKEDGSITFTVPAKLGRFRQFTVIVAKSFRKMFGFGEIDFRRDKTVNLQKQETGKMEGEAAKYFRDLINRKYVDSGQIGTLKSINQYGNVVENTILKKVTGEGVLNLLAEAKEVAKETKQANQKFAEEYYAELGEDNKPISGSKARQIFENIGIDLAEVGHRDAMVEIYNLLVKQMGENEYQQFTDEDGVGIEGQSGKKNFYPANQWLLAAAKNESFALGIQKLIKEHTGHWENFMDAFIHEDVGSLAKTLVKMNKSHTDCLDHLHGEEFQTEAMLHFNNFISGEAYSSISEQKLGDFAHLLAVDKNMQIIQDLISCAIAVNLDYDELGIFAREDVRSTAISDLSDRKVPIYDKDTGDLLEYIPLSTDKPQTQKAMGGKLPMLWFKQCFQGLGEVPGIKQLVIFNEIEKVNSSLLTEFHPALHGLDLPGTNKEQRIGIYLALQQQLDEYYPRN